MQHDRKVIEMALAPLVGLPLWAAGRAADLEWFEFGAQHVVVARAGKAKGTERTVGDFALVGMGAVVTKPVEAGSIVAGNPARVLRS